MTIEHRFTLYDTSGHAIYRDTRSTPLVLTLQAQSKAGDAYFDYMVSPPFHNVKAVLLEVHKDDTNEAHLVLKWATGGTPRLEFARVDDPGIPDLLGIVEGYSHRFIFPLPQNPTYHEYTLRRYSPTYHLKVTVKRKS